MIHGIMASGGGAGGGGAPSSPMALLAGFNGANNSQALVDEGPYGYAMSAIGNAKISTGASKFGSSSLYLDGTGDGVFLQYAEDFEFGSSPWTVDLWFNCTTLTNYRHLIGKRYSSAAGNVSWCITLFSNGTIEFFASADGTTITSGTSSAGAVTAATWHHLAVDVNASGVGRVYLDGTMVIKINTMPALLNNGHSITLGITGNASTYPFLGYIDELRIVKGSAEYDSDGGFTPPTTAYARPTLDRVPDADPYWANVAYLLGDDNTDGSDEMYDDSNDARVMIGRFATVTYEKDAAFGAPFGYGAFDMAGGSFYVDDADWALGTTQFTMEAWIRLTTNGVKFLAGQLTGTTAATSAWNFGTSTSGNLEFSYSNGTTRAGTFGPTTIGAGLPPLYTWCHIAVDRDASGVFRLYLNGKKIASDTGNTTFSIQNVAYYFTVGSNNTGANPIAAAVRDLRITLGTARYATDTTYTVPKRTFSRHESTAPTFSVAATIETDGFYAVGDTLTANPGTHNGRWTSYQWRKDGVDITGETDSTYTLVSGDIGSDIDVVVTATNYQGSATSTPTAVTVTASATFSTGALAPAGDMQSGSDRLIPAGDMQSGTDVLLWKERTA